MIQPTHHLPPRPTPSNKSYTNLHSTKPYDSRQHSGRSGAGFDRKFHNPSVSPSPQGYPSGSGNGMMNHQSGGMMMDPSSRNDMEINLDDIDADESAEIKPSHPVITTKIIHTYSPSPSGSPEVQFVQLANQVPSTSDMPKAPDFCMPALTNPNLAAVGADGEPRRKPNAFYAPALPVFPLPPLPPIINDEIRRRVFTHTSLYKDQAQGPVVGMRKGGFEDPIDRPARDYEKIEHVGDSILGMIITTWLHEIKPRLTIGTATKLKSYLVSNATLSHLSTLYSLPARLEADPMTLPVVRAQPDVRAALFEAYIAGVYYAHPLPTRGVEAWKVLDPWLREVYAPLVEFFYTAMKQEYQAILRASNIGPDGEDTTAIDNASVGMASLLQQYCSKNGLIITYKEEKVDLVDKNKVKLEEGVVKQEEGEEEAERRRRTGNIPMLTKTVIQVDLPEEAAPIIAEAIRFNRKVARNVAAYEAARQLGIAN